MGIALNIGCGDNIINDISGHSCINVDIRHLLGVQSVCDVKNLPFKDGCFDRILASDIIEHFPISETESVLAEWIRVLKIEGHIKFRTPDLRWISSEYLRKGDAKFMSWHIFGGQEYSKNFHYVVFDREWLSLLCAKFNLYEVSYKEVWSNFELVMVKKG
jgi:predicted SAM-dependent methyltransferase